ncbi:MAG TPA: ABC transporter ATP-binding protein [Rhodanobacteraceae bacterium]
MKLTIEKLQTRRGTFVAGPVGAQLAAGDCVALMGANGAGKTTLLETLAGFFQPETGRVSVDGTDITAWAPERRGFAYLPQDLALFPHLDVGGNVAFGARGAGVQRETAALIDTFELGAIRKLFPRQLSRGQAQRVALARALATHPRLLLLDEPTASLDAPGRRSFDAHMRALLPARGLIVIYATHNVLDSLSLATHLIVLEQGRVAQAGAPDALFRQPANAHVAELLGITNVWPVRSVDRSADGLVVDVAGGQLTCTRLPLPGDAGFVAIGPGEIEFSPERPNHPCNCFAITAQAVQVSGQVALIDAACSLGALRIALPPWRAGDVRAGERAWIHLPPERIRIIPAAAAD